ncbi:group II intron reverse transcriptase domain-containing protein [Candidatus Woesearchaeota archaeon]|nr:group II intron reverse transcriptase domain-containing protein [Candidatus Woesearchaeota archaeon]
MKTYHDLWRNIIDFDNLQIAYNSARKNKTHNPLVMEFDQHWRLNLCILLRELRDKTYKPLPLRTFVLRDPKTRIICVSDFRDRIVHHAIVNVLQPIFEKRFIYDSYASRRGKGVLQALNRFDRFKRKVTGNGRLRQNARNRNDVVGFALKADIKHYFQAVDHQVLLTCINKHIKDENVLWLVKRILDNYQSDEPSKGMPLGNWTSQFFANIYLHELDYFVKNQLKAKYYLRYVDDFVILHDSKQFLKECEEKIKSFLVTGLKLELHPDKCKIIPLRKGISFLGFRVFYHYKLPRKRNIRKIKSKLTQAIIEHENESRDAYSVLDLFQSWSAYAKWGNTYNIRQRIYNSIEKEFITLLPIQKING